MFKKTAIVAAAAAGLMMLGSPALAATENTENYDNKNHITGNSSQKGLINIGDVLSNNCSLINANVGIAQGIGILGAGGAQENNNTCLEFTATEY